MTMRTIRQPLERKDGSAGLARIACNLVELKFDPGTGAEADQMTFNGYGAVFGNVDSYGDVIAKGAFKNTIREAKASGNWPAMMLQHGAYQMTADDMTPIGVWTELKEDDTGLWVEGTLAPTQRGRDLSVLMKMKPRPAITGLSIGYRPVKWKMSDKPGEPRRTLTEVMLVEISPVTFPANPKSRVQSAKGAHGIRLAEHALRDAGFSATEAKAIVAGGFKSQPRQRDVGGLGDVAAALRRNIEDLS
jgi:uncharacterized protein